MRTLTVIHFTSAEKIAVDNTLEEVNQMLSTSSSGVLKAATGAQVVINPGQVAYAIVEEV
jgi:hypothetical protein